jgi:hypothetical protein
VTIDLDWGRYNRQTVAHECGHCLVAWVLGSTVDEIAVGPGTYEEFGTELAGYVIHDRESLSPFDQLCVSLAGTVAEPFNWHFGSGDMNRAVELVEQHHGRTPNFMRTEFFQSAVSKVKNILKQWSLALSCLILKLQRPPYKLSGAEINRVLNNCGVKREISSDC